MIDRFTNEPMLYVFMFETTQHVEQLETLILNSEKEGKLTADTINEVFRIMHTIKGSSAMMLFNDLSELAHSVEDLFFFLRENTIQTVNYSTLSDLVLASIDFVKLEMEKINQGKNPDASAANLIQDIRLYLQNLSSEFPHQQILTQGDNPKQQQYYISQDKNLIRPNKNIFRAVIFFADDCEMENIRAYTVVHNLKEIADVTYYLPEDIVDNDDSVNVIKELGFRIFFNTDRSFDEVHKLLNQTVFLKNFELVALDSSEDLPERPLVQSDLKNTDIPKLPDIDLNQRVTREVNGESYGSTHQNIISVNVDKLDRLMDLVGEMVIAEAMVIENPDLKGLELDNFQKAARQLKKISSEIQDMVMSIRMVPLANTFNKMQRVVRDMSKKLNKSVRLEIIGEKTEVDKNVIEHISDPLMHLVRNAIDHGLETDAERMESGKPIPSTVTLEAKSSGSDVLILVRDDGKGLNQEKILQRAKEHGLLTKSFEEMSDREIFNLIFLPGFSTKDRVTEFSGRGVGLDVVLRNIEEVGGSVLVDSAVNQGTTITLKIPLTLAIIDGMNIKVGNANYTIPTNAIKESFRPKEGDVIADPDGNEMIMVRGQCYPVKRLHKLYKVKTQVTSFVEGILIMVEHEHRALCLFADELLGQQQVVVKALPNYLKNLRKINGLAGCTLLGDGSISLILDIGSLFNNINNS